jgi:hypothetical protein
VSKIDCSRAITAVFDSESMEVIDQMTRKVDVMLPSNFIIGGAISRLDLMMDVSCKCTSKDRGRYTHTV